MGEKKKSGRFGKAMAGKWGNVVIVLCAALLIFCLVKVCISLAEYRKAQKLNDKLKDDLDALISGRVTTSQTSNMTDDGTTGSGTTAITDPPIPEPVVKEEYREIYDKITVLREQYPDVFGWVHIAFSDTVVIDLPVMQATDNNYYISHAYNGETSSAGAIFADYRNTNKRLDANQNVILYGHNMNNGSMFAKVSTYYKKSDVFATVPVILYTPEGMYSFEVFSVYNSKAGEDYDTIGFAGDDLKTFCEKKRLRSYIMKDLTFTGDETIITLVTCTNFASSGRVIVHGVLTEHDSYFVD